MTGVRAVQPDPGQPDPAQPRPPQPDPARPEPAAAAGPSGADSAGGAAGGDRRFEDLLAELEAVTDRLANGEIGIEEAAELYEHASGLHRQAAERLDAVRARVERLRDAEQPGVGPSA